MQAWCMMALMVEFVSDSCLRVFVGICPFKHMFSDKAEITTPHTVVLGAAAHETKQEM